MGIELKVEIAKHAKYHDDLKNLQPHMALVGSVQLPHAQLYLGAHFRSRSLPLASNCSGYQHPLLGQ